MDNETSIEKRDTTAAVSLAQAPIETPANVALQVLMNPQLGAAVDAMAELMSKGTCTLPDHFRGNKSDCHAVILKALQWGMDPYGIAAKTFVVGGKLGYEAQLQCAVLNSSKQLQGRLTHEYFGNWDQVIGKFELRAGKTGKDYAAPTYTAKDEEGLGIIIRGTLTGESDPRELRMLMKQAYPRQSTLWASDPRTQLLYAAEKRWASSNCPDVLLGAYTREELMAKPAEINVTPEATDDLAAELAAKPGAQKAGRDPAPPDDHADILAAAKCDEAMLCAYLRTQQKSLHCQALAELSPAALKHVADNAETIGGLVSIWMDQQA